MKIYEQADPGRDGPIYSWMISRAYATRREMERWGWKWIRGVGCRGVFVTNSPAAVRLAQETLRLDAPTSNGTHAAADAAMFAGW